MTNLAPTFAVATPSRGDVQSRTIESVLAAVADVEKAGVARRVKGQWWHLSHGLPIPEAHEKAMEAALDMGADFVWVVEADNVPPLHALTDSFRRILRGDAGLVAVPYPVGEPPPAGPGIRWDSIYYENGEVMFTGLGVTLIRREVFESLDRPWFRVDRKLVRQGDRIELVPAPDAPAGHVDVVFGLRVREAGWKLDAVPGMVAGHIRTVNFGARPANKSPHEIELWDTIDRQQETFSGLHASRFPPDYAAEFDALGPWVTKFNLGGRWYGGKFDAMNDPRLKLCRDRFPNVRSVMELGSLECGHTVAISQWVDKVLAFEGREDNIRRAQSVLNSFEVTNVELVHANLEQAELPEGFDLVYCVGLLYHLPEPVRLLAEMARVSPRLFLWTHHGGAADKDYREFGLADPLSGLSDRSLWLSRDRLLGELGKRYRTVEVLDEEQDHHGAGPAITIAAER